MTLRLLIVYIIVYSPFFWIYINICKKNLQKYAFLLKFIKIKPILKEWDKKLGEKIMTGSIDPISTSAAGVGGAMGYGASPTPSKSEAPTPEVSSGITQTPVDPNAVLNFMSANAALSMPTRSVDPSKYVNAESAARIASFMGSFEDRVAQGLQAFEQEFAGIDVSDGAKMAVVLGQINKEI